MRSRHLARRCRTGRCPGRRGGGEPRDRDEAEDDGERRPEEPPEPVPIEPSDHPVRAAPVDRQRPRELTEPPPRARDRVERRADERVHVGIRLDQEAALVQRPDQVGDPRELDVAGLAEALDEDVLDRVLAVHQRQEIRLPGLKPVVEQRPRVGDHRVVVAPSEPERLDLDVRREDGPPGGRIHAGLQALPEVHGARSCGRRVRDRPVHAGGLDGGRHGPGFTPATLGVQTSLDDPVDRQLRRRPAPGGGEIPGEGTDEQRPQDRREDDVPAERTVVLGGGERRRHLRDHPRVVGDGQPEPRRLRERTDHVGMDLDRQVRAAGGDDHAGPANAQVRAGPLVPGADEDVVRADRQPAALDLVREALDLIPIREHDRLDEVQPLPPPGHDHVRSQVERGAPTERAGHLALDARTLGGRRLPGRDRARADGQDAHEQQDEGPTTPTHHAHHRAPRGHTQT